MTTEVDAVDTEVSRAKSAGLWQLPVDILRKAFDVYDVDASGAIDHEELRSLLSDLGWPAHDHFLSRALRILDADCSGEVEFSEFRKWTQFAYASRVLYPNDMFRSIRGGGASLVGSATMPRNRRNPADRDESSMSLLTEGVMDAYRPYLRDSRTEMSLPAVPEGDEFRTICSDNPISCPSISPDVSDQPCSTGSIGRTSRRRSSWRIRPLPLASVQDSKEGRQRVTRLRFMEEPREVSVDDACIQTALQFQEPLTALEPSPEFGNGDRIACTLVRTDSDAPHIVNALNSLDENSASSIAEYAEEEIVSLSSSDLPKACGVRSESCAPREQFSSPITRMASMVLRGKRERKGWTLTSRIRGQSLSRMATGSSFVGSDMGARCESKVTVRMRFACGQFEEEKNDSDEESPTMHRQLSLPAAGGSFDGFEGDFESDTVIDEK